MDLFTADIRTERGIANGTNITGGDGPGYLTNEKEAPNTNRQFTSDYEYVGGAMTKEPSQMRYEHMYNANLNEVREGTLVGRKPTDSNVPLAVGMDKINIETKKAINLEKVSELMEKAPGIKLVDKREDGEKFEKKDKGEKAKKLYSQAFKKLNTASGQIPFGPYISAGTLLTILTSTSNGDNIIIDWYLRTMF